MVPMADLPEGDDPAGGDRAFTTTILLLREARSGKREALDGLFERYLPRVRRIVALRLGFRLRDLATYEDLVQEALLRAFEKLDTFREMGEGTFRNWIATCVATAVNLHFKKEGARKRGGGKVVGLDRFPSESLSAAVLKDEGPGPSTVAEARDLEERVEEALLSLKGHQREVIVLRHLCEMNSEEIARAMGFGSAATVRKVLSRAMDALREALGSAPPPGGLAGESS
jgi:RNA polymerase sigma-70 factor (ECF subfamily)